MLVRVLTISELPSSLPDKVTYLAESAELLGKVCQVSRELDVAVFLLESAKPIAPSSTLTVMSSYWNSLASMVGSVETSEEICRRIV